MDLSLINPSSKPTNTNPLLKTEIVTKFKLNTLILLTKTRKKKHAIEDHEEKGEEEKDTQIQNP